MATVPTQNPSAAELQDAAQRRSVDAFFQERAAVWTNQEQEANLRGAIYLTRRMVILRWVDALEIPKGQRILEVGCGAGWTSAALALRGHTIEALDSVAEMLAQTQTAARQAEVAGSVHSTRGDVHNLPFATDQFALTLAIGVVPWVHSAPAALTEMVRVTRPGGYVLLSADNRWRLNHVLDPWLCPALTQLREGIGKLLSGPQQAASPSARPVAQFHSSSEVDRWLAAAGLEKVRSTTVGFGPFSFHYRAILGDQTGLLWHRRFQQLADRNVPGLRSAGAHYIVLARKSVPCLRMPSVLNGGSLEAV